MRVQVSPSTVTDTLKALGSVPRFSEEDTRQYLLICSMRSPVQVNWKKVSSSRSAVRRSFTLPSNRLSASPSLASAESDTPCEMMRTAERSTIVAEKSSSCAAAFAFTTATAKVLAPACR